MNQCINNQETITKLQTITNYPITNLPAGKAGNQTVWLLIIGY